MIEIQKLKESALAISEGHSLTEWEASDAMVLFEGLATPAAVLELIADLESTNARLHEVAVACATAEQERDQLKAENEALRKDAKRYRFLRNQHWPVAYLAVVVNPKVSVKLGHDCPSGDRLDEQVDGAMKREASHD